MSAAYAFPTPAPPTDPVAALLFSVGPDPVPAADLAGLWGMAPDDALDVAAEAEAAGLLTTIEGDDGGPLVSLTAAGRRRAGLDALEDSGECPAGHRRIAYYDAWGVKRWLVVPADVARGIDSFDRRTRRHDAAFRERVVTGSDHALEFDVFDLAVDPDAPDPVRVAIEAEEAARPRKPDPAPAWMRSRPTPPRPTLILGIAPVWQGPAPADGPCPGCKGRPLGLTTCCVLCDAMGNAALLEPVWPSERPRPAPAPKAPPKPKATTRPKPTAPALDRRKSAGKAKGFDMRGVRR